MVLNCRITNIQTFNSAPCSIVSLCCYSQLTTASMNPPTSPPFSQMAAAHSTPGTPHVVINEPQDDALVRWLQHCRLDSTSIDKVRDLCDLLH